MLDVLKKINALPSYPYRHSCWYEQMCCMDLSMRCQIPKAFTNINEKFTIISAERGQWLFHWLPEEWWLLWEAQINLSKLLVSSNSWVNHTGRNSSSLRILFNNARNFLQYYKALRFSSWEIEISLPSGLLCPICIALLLGLDCDMDT